MSKRRSSRKTEKKRELPEDIARQFIKPTTFRHLVRIAHVDVRGDTPLLYALTNVKGVGYSLAHAIIRVLNLDPFKLAGFLTDEEILKIEDVLRDPVKYEIPSWMVNRPRDPETGENLHYIGPDLDLRIRQDIELMKQIKSWKGIRHALGLKVRGQRTRTTGRKGLTVGVKRRG